MAQSVEQLIRNQQVASSILASSSKKIMEIIKVLTHSNLFSQNSYIVCEKNDAILIDAGASLKDVLVFSKPIKAIFLTHCHYDHIMFLTELQNHYACPIFISKLDADGLFDKVKNGTIRFAKRFELNDNLKNHIKIVSDNEIIQIGELKIKTLLTPGHTNGSACFLIDENIFTGDTLFADCIGRTDFATGSLSEMKSSLNRLDLVEYQNLYPGHMRQSNKAEQRVNIKYWLSLD